MSAKLPSPSKTTKSTEVKSRREKTRAARLATTSENQLLYSSEQVCHLLGNIHKTTLVRHEAAGRLHPVKLNPGKLNAKKYYARDEVLALVKSLTATANLAGALNR